MGRVPRKLQVVPLGRERAVPLLIALCLALACAAPAPPGDATPSAGSPAALAQVRDGRYVMGTVLEVTLEATDRTSAERTAGELLGRAAELEAVLSTWRPDSATSRLNADAGGPARPVPTELRRLLGECLRFTAETGGVFDVTVGPLVDLWRRAGERGRVPDEAEIRAALSRVGPGHVHVGAEGVRLDAGTRVDFGGVAKGFTLDRLGELLAERGVERALLSFGQSSLLARGAPAGGAGWRILLRDAAGGYAGILTLRDQSVSISGSLGQTTEIAGRPYGHIVDPRSGRPLTRAVQAVVVASSGARAEALSKALLVLPAAEGLALAESDPGTEAALIEADGRLQSTTGFRAAVRLESAGERNGP